MLRSEVLLKGVCLLGLLLLGFFAGCGKRSSDDLVDREGMLISTIPVALGNITTLRELYLLGNTITGDVPASLAGVDVRTGASSVCTSVSPTPTPFPTPTPTPTPASG